MRKCPATCGNFGPLDEIAGRGSSVQFEGDYCRKGSCWFFKIALGCFCQVAYTATRAPKCCVPMPACKAGVYVSDLDLENCISRLNKSLYLKGVDHDS